MLNVIKVGKTWLVSDNENVCEHKPVSFSTIFNLNKYIYIFFLLGLIIPPPSNKCYRNVHFLRVLFTSSRLNDREKKK